jgi:ribonuclease P protein component
MMKREERITRPRQYAEIYGKGKSYPSELLVLRILPNNLDHSRYGLSVSKKVGNAVIRNTLKRRLREINRMECFKPGWDIVYIVRPAAAGASFSSLKESVETLLAKADILEKEGND